MTRASSDAAAGSPATRIIAGEAMQRVAAFDLGELSHGATAPRRLSSRDLDNEVARAAYAMGRKRGFEQGSRLGLQQGFSEGSQALQEFQSRKAADLANQVATIIASFRTELAALESQVASDLVSLAIDIARQVLRRELAHDEAALLPAAREAVRALGEGASQMNVHLHPADAALLGDQLDAPAQGSLRVTADASLARGGCRVEADTGIADASFETRWHAVMASLGRDEEPLP